MLNFKAARKIVAIAVVVVAQIWTSVVLADVVVIVNKDNDNTVMRRSELKNIFLAKKKAFKDGRMAVVVYQPGSNASRTEFDSRYLGKTVRQVQSYWRVEMFKGGAMSPRELENDSDVLHFVSSNRNAIGYIDGSALNGSVIAVKIVD